MDQEHTKQLIDYIQTHLAQGISEDAIRQTLLAHNWSQEWVDHAFMVMQQQAQSSVPVSSAAASPLQDLQGNPTQQSSQAQAAPQKYKVFRAIGDTFVSITKNPLNFIVVTIATLLIGGLLTLLSGVVLAATVYGGSLFARPSLGVIILGLLVSAFIQAAIQTFIVLGPSVVLYEAAEGRKIAASSAMTTAVKRLIRVMLANLLYYVVIFSPLFFSFVYMLVSSLSTLGNRGGSAGGVIIGMLLVLATFAWALIAMLRFALVPFVALFEPEIPLVKTLSRSQHLLLKGGQWFIFKGVILCMLVLIIIGAVFGAQNAQELQANDNLGLTLILLIAGTIINGVAVMLYRNRKLIRG